MTSKRGNHPSMMAIFCHLDGLLLSNESIRSELARFFSFSYRYTLLLSSFIQSHQRLHKYSVIWPANHSACEQYGRRKKKETQPTKPRQSTKPKRGVRILCPHFRVVIRINFRSRSTGCSRRIIIRRITVVRSVNRRIRLLSEEKKNSRTEVELATLPALVSTLAAKPSPVCNLS